MARWTGIPVAKLMEGEREKLLHLDEVLHKRVIGQNEAVTRVTEAILRTARASRTKPAHRLLPVPWAPPAWARPSWPKPWRNACLTTRKHGAH